MPRSQAILSPWKRPQSSAVVTDPNPMFMPKPNCHFPEQSLTKPPALARPFCNRDPSVFNVKKDSGGACHLTSLMILLLWPKLRVDRAFWMSWAQDLISATTCKNLIIVMQVQHVPSNAFFFYVYPITVLWIYLQLKFNQKLHELIILKHDLKFYPH